MRLWALGRCLCMFALVVSVILVPGCKPEPEPRNPSVSPELQRFFDKCEEIREEMKEEEADAIMKDYGASSRLETREHAPNGKPFKRQSLRTKWYESKHDATEGDYIFLIYLDKDGYIVGKHLSKSSKVFDAEPDDSLETLTNTVKRLLPTCLAELLK